MGLVVVLFISAVLWSLCPLIFFTCFFFGLRLDGVLLETCGCVAVAVALALMVPVYVLLCAHVFVRFFVFFSLMFGYVSALFHALSMRYRQAFYERFRFSPTSMARDTSCRFCVE